MDTSFLWLGIFSIVVFVALDTFTDNQKAIWGGVLLTVGELLFTLFKFKTLDYLTIFAFIVVLVFGGISLKTKNDFFFKIQGPVVMLVISLFVLVAMVFGINVMVDMAEKYVGLEKLAEANKAISVEQIKASLTRMNHLLPWFLIFHSLINIYAAKFWNKWVWFLIRVPGFYATLVLIALFSKR